MLSFLNKVVLLLALMAVGARIASPQGSPSAAPGQTESTASIFKTKAQFVTALKEAIQASNWEPVKSGSDRAFKQKLFLTEQEALGLLAEARDEYLKSYAAGGGLIGDRQPESYRADLVGKLRKDLERKDQAKVKNAMRESGFLKLDEKLSLSPDEIQTQVNRVKEIKVKEFISSLPRDEDFFVLEGDLLLTAAEVAKYLSDGGAAGGYSPAGDLSINTYRANEPSYPSLSSRRLTYVVDRRTFSDPQYHELVKGLAGAARDWYQDCAECKIEFLPPTEDQSPDLVVRFHDANGLYSAALYVTESGSRVLNIDPSFFAASEIKRAGMLRHQIGHILGYAHTTHRDPSGCYYENGGWKPAATSELPSVMQYFCSASAEGSSSGDFALNLSSKDREEHRRRYALPVVSYALGSDPSAADKSMLIIRLQGGPALDNVADVLRILHANSLLKAGRHEVNNDGETVLDIYREKLRFRPPTKPEALLRFADDFNKRRLPREALSRGEIVLYPDGITVNEGWQTTTVRSDEEIGKKQLAELRLDWPAELREEVTRAESDRVLVKRLIYELRVFIGDEAKASQVLQQISNLFTGKRTEHITLALDGTERRPAGFSRDREPSLPSASAEKLEAYPVSPRQGAELLSAQKFPTTRDEIKIGREWLLGSLIKMPYPLPTKTCRDKYCPEVMLIDQSVASHPDLPAIPLIGERRRPNPPLSAAANPTSIQFELKAGVDKSRPNGEHGTYMAGIIGSQENGFGLIGIYPQVPIVSVEFDSYPNSNLTNLTSLMNRRYKDPDTRISSRAIVVLAADFKYDFKIEHYNAEYDDRRKNELAKFIEETATEILWVVAAGQKEEEKRGADLSPTYGLGPMNLGDRPNVITVTAYEPVKASSEEGNALIEAANRATEKDMEMVHVSAPGKDIPGSVNSGPGRAAYAVSGMTSPATAIVAGLVAAMRSTWPDDYEVPSQVKTRLQVTSRTFYDLSQRDFVHAGIIDADLALRNPHLNYYRTDAEYLTAHQFDWNHDEIRLRIDNKIETIQTEDIYRVYRTTWLVKTGDNSSREENGWVIYKRSLNRGKPVPGEIVRLRPGQIIGIDKFVVKINGSDTNLDSLKDILLAKPIAPNSEAQTNPPIQDITKP